MSFTVPTTATDDARDSSLPYPNIPLNAVFLSAVPGGSPHARTPPCSSPGKFIRNKLIYLYMRWSLLYTFVGDPLGVVELCPEAIEFTVKKGVLISKNGLECYTDTSRDAF